MIKAGQSGNIALSGGLRCCRLMEMMPAWLHWHPAMSPHAGWGAGLSTVLSQDRNIIARNFPMQFNYPARPPLGSRTQSGEAVLVAVLQLCRFSCTRLVPFQAVSFIAIAFL